MSFTDAIKTCFNKYADFSGTASRSEFWWWVLFCLIGSIVLEAVNYRIGIAFTLATFVPYIAVTARRLHDVNRSGWWQLVGLVPLVGWILLIYWCVQEGDSATQYA